MDKVELILREFPEANLMGSYFPCHSVEAKGAILIGCAMGITQTYYRHLAEFLCGQGYNVLTFDFRGTGSSAPRRLKGYQVDLFDWVDDIRSAILFLKNTNENLKLTFIGHSLSSQLFGFVEKNNLVDHAIFLASSTGYWKDGRGVSKWKNLFLLSVVMPFSNVVWGFTNAKFFGQGENYPKGPSLHWKSWCLHHGYLEKDLTDNNSFFGQFKKTIQLFYFTDDPIANSVSAKKLITLYKSADSHLVAIRPSEMNESKIGHTGFLSRRFKPTLWKYLADVINGS